jgi:hypothetical protein
MAQSVPNRIAGRSIGAAFFTFMLRKQTRRPALRVIGIILRYFFFLQFARKLGIDKTPIVYVDHPLDETIPFRTQHVKLYLSFTHFWIKSIAFLYKEFGKAALPHIRELITGIADLYFEAAMVYRHCMSTTNRPKNVGGLYFRIIHIFDPHLLCIPSLHVEVVNYNYFKMEDALKDLAKDISEYKGELEYLKNQALAITESILFIKQHSVNCIAAGLFVLTHGKTSFPRPRTLELIDSLFHGNLDHLDNAEVVRNYIRKLYDSFESEGNRKPYAEVLVDFLQNYDQDRGRQEEKQTRDQVS